MFSGEKPSQEKVDSTPDMSGEKAVQENSANDQKVTSILDKIIQKLTTDDGRRDIIIEELKSITLRYVKKMRILPYPDYDFNLYPFMSRIIVEELLDYSIENPEEEVKMFIGDVKSEFYGRDILFKRISELASNGIKFNIILAKPPKDNYLNEWRDLHNKFQDKIKIRMKTRYDSNLCHLILIRDAYRIEVPHEDYDGQVTDFLPLRPARFGFHDESYAQSVVLEHWNNGAIKDAVNLDASF